MSKPQVSVIVPCYNCEKSVARTLSSIAAQTIQDFEIIAVNDGSTDETGRVLDALARKDPRIRVIHQENGGVSAARNRGLEEAGGSFLAFVDADDLLIPQALEILLALDTGKEDILCAGHLMRYMDEGGREETLCCSDGDLQTVLESLVRGDSALNSMCAKLYRRDFVKANRLKVPAGIKVGEDMLFNLEAFYAAGAWRMTDAAVYVYELGGQSAMMAAFSDPYANSLPMLAGIEQFLAQKHLQTKLFRAHIDIYLRTLRRDRGREKAALAFDREIVRTITAGVDFKALCTKQKLYYLALRIWPCLSYFLP